MQRCVSCTRNDRGGASGLCVQPACGVQAGLNRRVLCKWPRSLWLRPAVLSNRYVARFQSGGCIPCALGQARIQYAIARVPLARQSGHIERRVVIAFFRLQQSVGSEWHCGILCHSSRMNECMNSDNTSLFYDGWEGCHDIPKASPESFARARTRHAFKLHARSGASRASRVYSQAAQLKHSRQSVRVSCNGSEFALGKVPAENMML